MKGIFSLLISVFFFQFASCQEIDQNQKTAACIKIWGFLKYYHPNVANGKFDWDTELNELISISNKAKNKTELSISCVNWIKKFGPIQKLKTSKSTTTENEMNKNFDLNWIQDKSVFTDELIQILTNIEENRHQGQQHYVKANSVGGIEIINEKEYQQYDWTKKELRLITLARYWNIIEYFFPYKYAADKKWNQVLLDMIPKFISPKSEEEFHLAMLELVVAIDDSHGMFMTPKTNNYFGFKWLPAKYKIINNKAIITAFYNDTLAKNNDIQIGDVITKVNGISIAELLKKNKKYINASNAAVKLRNSNYSIFNGNSDSVSVEVERNNVISLKKYKRYFLDSFIEKSQTIAKWKLLNENTGYVNMGTLTLKDVDQMMSELKDTKSIIFDVRNYPKNTLYKIAQYLSPKKTPFVQITMPVLNYPGKFIWTNALTCGSNNKNKYTGKIIILVDEETQSHAEFTVMAFQTYNKAITIGSQTAGADGNVSEVILAGGFKSLMTGIGVYYPDKSETQRVGIKIDYEIKPTIDGIKNGRDEVLEKAIELAK